MLDTMKNGNGATGVPKIKGTSIANRHANKRQLAALAAAVLVGDVDFKPSARQLAQLFNVSVTYLALAQQLTAAERAKIIAGEETINFTDLLNAPTKPLALPAP